MRVTLTELAAGEGWNEGPELRLLVQADALTTVPRAIEKLTPQERALVEQYRREPSDYKPLLRGTSEFRYNEIWAFPKETV